MIVNDFSQRKVSSYLDSGNYKNVLLKFHHGLGDIISFYPAFEKLQKLYPDISFYLNLHCGQDEIFSCSPEDETLYDIVFEIKFSCSEWTHPEYTKAEYCCQEELGIAPPDTAVRMRKYFASPLIGTHFFSTCLPNRLSCDESTAKKITDAIYEAGLIPIDTHMKHENNNPVNNAFSWMNCRIDNAQASLKNLLGVISRCGGFAGVSSGNFHAATALLPEDTLLFIKTDIPVCTLTRKNILELDVKNYDHGIVKEWLQRTKERLHR